MLDPLSEYESARAELLAAVARYQRAETAEESAHAAWEAEYADGLVGLAARRLVHAIDNGPDSIKPVGWDVVAESGG